ncbi:MAG: lipopolysaccharide biosynthesis protein [Acidimicrobiales bacterium]
MTTPPAASPGRLRGRIARIGPEGLGGRAGWATVVEVLQLASSLLVFIVLANLLTTADMGIMGAVLGAAVPVASLSGFGSHVLLIKRVAQGGHVADSWRRSTAIGLLGPAAGSLVMIAARPVLMPDIDPWTYGLLMVSQVNFFWLTELAVYLGNGSRRLKEAAQLRAMVVGCRFAALLAFAVLGEGRLLGWAIASFASFGLGAVLSLFYVWRVFGATPSIGQGSLADLREGLPYSVNAVSESLVDVSDRPLLVNYGHAEDAGIYSVGGRIIQFGYLPLRILMRASDADLFESGRQGVRSALRLTRSLLLPAAAIGSTVGLAFALAAPLVPVLAGDKYDEAVEAIRLLAILPLVRGIQYLMGNCLSATDHQWWRVGATIAAAALNFGLNLRLLPDGTWRTAVFTTIVSELFLTAFLAVAVYGWAWRERRGDDDERERSRSGLVGDG